MSATAAATQKAVIPSANGEQSIEELSAEVGKSLAAKLANTAMDIDRVAKRGHNRQQNYDFATAGDIFDEIRAKLAGQRVALHWTIDRENTKFDEVTSQSGSKGLLCTLWITYSFVDGDDGSRLDYYTVGTANDFPGDKAVYKAQTNALKYLLMQTFLVSTGDDVEGESGSGQSATYADRSSRPPESGGASNLNPDQALEISALNASLPKPYNDTVLAAMSKSGYPNANAALRKAHLDPRQCGESCVHLAKA